MWLRLRLAVYTDTKKLIFPTWESHAAQYWLQFVLTVASFYLNTLTQSNTQLMHCSVNDSLVEVTPLFDKSLLQMVNVSNPGTVHTFLEHTPHFVVDLESGEFGGHNHGAM